MGNPIRGRYESGTNLAKARKVAEKILAGVRGIDGVVDARIIQRLNYPRFTIDDRPCTDRAILPLPGVVSCDAFTFAVEPVSGRL